MQAAAEVSQLMCDRGEKFESESVSLCSLPPGITIEDFSLCVCTCACACDPFHMLPILQLVCVCVFVCYCVTVVMWWGMLV